MKEILDVVHKTIYQFFDECGDGEDVPMSDKDKLLLEVNKAICNNLKALERPCKDAISRKAVKEGMIKYGFLAPDMTVTEFVENELPPVTPTRKKGKWIKVSEKKPNIENGVTIGTILTIKEVCSECSCTNASCYKSFCPNCGAEMEGEE